MADCDLEDEVQGVDEDEDNNSATKLGALLLKPKLSPLRKKSHDASRDTSASSRTKSTSLRFRRLCHVPASVEHMSRGHQ
eukprot:1343329-Ditylum_brightwellii.AAC.1